MTIILTIPGLFDSGPDHWQTHWERALPNMHRIRQRDYEQAVCSEWIDTIEAAVRRHGPDVVLVAHSCGSIAIAHWAVKHPQKIAGAMLVGPSDAEMPDFPPNAIGFTPIPLQRLPFPAIVVASSDDPFVTSDRASYFAKSWSAQLINIGPAGHINTASGHGAWPEGRKILEEFVKTVGLSAKDAR
jgi:serine hydrolase